MRWFGHTRALAALILTLALAAPLAGLYDWRAGQHAAHARDPNDHAMMFSGGLPGYAGLLPLQALGAYCDPDGGACVEEAGLGDAPPARSYVDEPPLDMTIYRTVDHLSCHPQHKDTKEVGIHYVYDADVRQDRRSPAADAPRDGCVRWHSQADPNFVGRQINQVGRDGTGKRAPVALQHGFVMEVPNPDFGTGGPYAGRYLHFEGMIAAFQIAVSRCEVWYQKQHLAEGYGRNLGGHTFGQVRIPICPTTYRTADGRELLGMAFNADGVFTWKTCGARAAKRPGDEGVPCVNSTLDAARGSAFGASHYNPNTTAVPHDRFGNRLLPLSYAWVKCLADQDFAMPAVRDGEGAWLNPHQWRVGQPSVIRPYAPAHCQYPEEAHAVAAAPPAAGPVGVPNEAPAPEPTGVVPTATATAPPGATATAEARPFFAPWDRAVYYGNADLAGEPALVVEGRPGDVVSFEWGNDAPNAAVGRDFWSAVYYGTFQSSISAIRVRGDDGVRVFIAPAGPGEAIGDGELIFDGWENPPYRSVVIPVTIPDDTPQRIRVEYREHGGGSRLHVELFP